MYVDFLVVSKVAAQGMVNYVVLTTYTLLPICTEWVQFLQDM